MEFHEYGDTVEERVKEFQRGLMWTTIYRGLLFFVVKSLLASLLGHTNTILYSLVLTLVFFKYAIERYKEYDIHSSHEVFTYKGKMHRIREKEPSDITLKLEKQVRKNMVLTATAFVGAGSFVEDAMRLMPEEFGILTMIAYMSIGVLTATPLWVIYLVAYQKMSKLLTTAVVAPAFGIVYTNLMREDEEFPDSEVYLTWRRLSERKRKKEYTAKENEKLKEVHDTIEDSIDKDVRILPSAFGVVDKIDAESDEEIEDKVKSTLKEQGIDANVTVVRPNEEDSKGKGTEEIEEYDLSEIDTTYEDEGERVDESERK